MMRMVVAFFMVVSLMGLGLVERVEATRGESPKEVALKIGYMDISQVIDRYPKAKEVEEALRKEQEAKEKKLLEMQEAISKLEAELTAQESFLKEEDKEGRARTIEIKRREWEQLFREYDLELRSKVMEKQREVLDSVRQAAQSFGKEKGYTLILDSRPIIYGLEGLDVTEEVIKWLNGAPEHQDTRAPKH